MANRRRRVKRKQPPQRTAERHGVGLPLPPKDARKWEIYCDRDCFDGLRENEAFHRLVDLARHVNALRYGISAAGIAQHDNTPNGDRQRAGTFYYFGGVLFEAFKLLPELRRHFGDRAAWKSGFATFGEDADILRRLKRGGDLYKLRNHTSFHFLPIVAPQSLKQLQMAEYAFTTGEGSMTGYVYHNLADVVGMHYAVGSPADGKQFHDDFLRLTVETRDLALEFATFGDRLIGMALREFGFRKRDRALHGK